MNHGRTVYVGHDAVHLTEDLLRPLSIIKGSSVSGLYYPPPAGDDYLDVWPRHDLMITPIPDFKWPFVASLKIRIIHKPGTIAELAYFLNKQDINILSAQCTRSGHRHATWYLVVEFNKLHTSDATKRDYEELTKSLDHAARSLHRKIKQGFSSVLFDSGKWHDPRTPIEVSPLRALLYFFEQARSRKDVRVFRVKCEDNSKINFKDTDVLGNIIPSSELPTLGLATMDTEFFNIRVAVLPKRQLKRFRLVSVDYSQFKSESEETSQGLFSCVASRLVALNRWKEPRAKKTWNLWRVFNQTERNDEKQEMGKIIMSAQHLQTEPGESHIRDLRNQLEVAASEASPGLKVRVNITPISARRLFVSLRNKKAFPKRDDVIGFIRHELAGEIGILPDEVIVFESHVAPSITEEVKKEMQQCTGMLQFFMFNTKDDGRDIGQFSTDWLNGEYFLSTSIPLPCVRIVDPELVDRMMIFGRDQPHISLSRAAGDDEFKECIRDALLELNEKMGGRV